jgi:hypothetical protein
LVISHLRKQKQIIIVIKASRPCWSDSNQTASAKPGAIQEAKRISDAVLAFGRRALPSQEASLYLNAL